MSKESDAMEMTPYNEPALRLVDSVHPVGRFDFGWKRRIVAVMVPVCAFGACAFLMVRPGAEPLENQDHSEFPQLMGSVNRGCAVAQTSECETTEVDSNHRFAAQPVQHFFHRGGRIAGLEVVVPPKTHSGTRETPHKDVSIDSVADRLVAYAQYGTRNIGVTARGGSKQLRGRKLILGDVLRFVSVTVLEEDLGRAEVRGKIQERCDDGCQTLGVVQVAAGGSEPPMQKKRLIQAVQQFKNETRLSLALADARCSLLRSELDPSPPAKHWFRASGEVTSHGDEDWDIATDVVNNFEFFKLDVEFVRQLVLDHTDAEFTAEHANALATKLLVQPLAANGSEKPPTIPADPSFCSPSERSEKQFVRVRAAPIYLEVFKALRLLSANSIPSIFEFPLQRGLEEEDFGFFWIAQPQEKKKARGTFLGPPDRTAGHVRRLGPRIFLVAMLYLEKQTAQGKGATADGLEAALRPLAAQEKPFGCGNTLQDVVGYKSLGEALQNSKLIILVQGVFRGEETWGHPDLVMQKVALDVLANDGKYLELTNGWCRPVLEGERTKT